MALNNSKISLIHNILHSKLQYATTLLGKKDKIIVFEIVIESVNICTSKDQGRSYKIGGPGAKRHSDPSHKNVYCIVKCDLRVFIN